MQTSPNEYNAGCYAGVLHWLKGVKAANMLDADAVAAERREMPLNDFHDKDMCIQPNAVADGTGVYIHDDMPDETPSVLMVPEVRLRRQSR